MVNINQQKQPVLLGRARFETLQEDVSVESENGLFENFEALGPQSSDQPNNELITESKTHESKLEEHQNEARARPAIQIRQLTSLDSEVSSADVQSGDLSFQSIDKNAFTSIQPHNFLSTGNGRTELTIDNDLSDVLYL